MRCETQPTFREIALMEAGMSAKLGEGYFDVPSEEILRGFEMSLPLEVEVFCTEIASLGGRALVVGGAVRDMVIDREKNSSLSPKDIDLEIYGVLPDDLLFLVDAFFWARGSRNFWQEI